MAVFLSTFINKIDKKGRVSVPASFRALLAKQLFPGIIVFRSYKYAAIEACGYDRMEYLMEGINDMAMFSEPQEDLTAAIFADAEQLPFDQEGRIMLPQALLTHTGINDQVAFAGCGATFQMWHPDVFREHQEKARLRIRNLSLTIPPRKASAPASVEQVSDKFQRRGGTP